MSGWHLGRLRDYFTGELLDGWVLTENEPPYDAWSLIYWVPDHTTALRWAVANPPQNIHRDCGRPYAFTTKRGTKVCNHCPGRIANAYLTLNEGDA